jgi:hypothetical protein
MLFDGRVDVVVGIVKVYKPGTDRSHIYHYVTTLIRPLFTSTIADRIPCLIMSRSLLAQYADRLYRLLSGYTRRIARLSAYSLRPGFLSRTLYIVIYLYS